MTFASPSADPQSSTTPEPGGQVINQTWWPNIDLDNCRAVLRLDGTVTVERLTESLRNAIYSVNHELRDWKTVQGMIEPVELADERLCHLYRRAVYFDAQAELIERYRNFDATAAGQRKAEEQQDTADDARRTKCWAISDILGIPRTTIELM